MSNSLAERFDALTIDDLRARGSLKWTHFPDAIGAWVAELDYGLAPVIHDALTQMLTDERYGYATPRMLGELSAACADYHREQHGWAIDPEQVVAIPEVLTGLHVVLSTYLEPGAKVILPTPAYMPFLTIPPAHDSEIIQVPMLCDGDSWTMDLDALDAAFRSGGRLLVLANPHNPIGKVYSADELRAICEVVTRHGGFVFNDEIHAPLRFDGVRHVPYPSISDAASAHTITAVSTSKAWNLAGLKCAQLIITDADLLATWRRRGARLAGEAANPGIIANTAAYRSGQPWLDEVLAYLQANRDLAVTTLNAAAPQLKVIAPQGTYLLWVDARESGLPNPHQTFLDAGVALTDGALCGADSRGFVRLNFGTGRPILAEALDRMVAALPG